jgi:nitroimidazol reductase NimA-like FMN-containing flavoprotein (pyridoxamine 5'-phosphate oxidase superfamily)
MDTACSLRREDRRITDRSVLQDILRTAKVCHLGLALGGVPYVVPLCYGAGEDCIYVHSAPEGRKMTMLRQNPRVCVEIEEAGETIPAPLACGWELEYRSVIIDGTAEILSDPEDKRRGLACIMENVGAPAETLPDAALERVAVIRIRIHAISGKSCQCRQT